MGIAELKEEDMPMV